VRMTVRDLAAALLGGQALNKLDGRNHAEVTMPTPAGSWPLSPLPML
jgi:hypothetical protein